MSDANFEGGFLERFMEIHGVTSDADLARALGRSPSSVHNWRKRGNIPIDECIRVAKLKGTSLDWLILGKREDKSSAIGHALEDNSTPILASSTPSPDHFGVPMYDVEGAAGSGRSLECEPIESVLYFPIDQLSDQGLVPDQVVGIKVRGDSMESTLSDGDWVLVDRSSTDPRQEGVFLLLVSGERRIKRVQRLAGGALYLISDNEHYQPEMIRPDQMREVQILGRCEVRIGKIF